MTDKKLVFKNVKYVSNKGAPILTAEEFFVQAEEIAYAVKMPNVDVLHIYMKNGMIFEPEKLTMEQFLEMMG